MSKRLDEALRALEEGLEAADEAAALQALLAEEEEHDGVH